MCQLNVVRECKKIRLLRRALKTLPKTLDETYERILSNIPEDYIEDVQRVLQCLICAFHPLDLREVAEIVAIDPAEPYYHPEDRYSAPRELLSVCSGLVCTRTSRRRGGRYNWREFDIEELRLAHFSVKEYLVSDRVGLGSASKYKFDGLLCHATMADLCISYLLQYEEGIHDRWSVTTNSNLEAQESGDKQPDPEADRHFHDLMLCESSPFAPYAAMFWSMHIRAARLDDTKPLCPKILKLIGDPVLLDRIVSYYRQWFDAMLTFTLQHFGIQGDPKAKDPLVYPLGAKFSPVYYASLFGLDYHVRQLLEAGECVDSMGPSGTALVAAASKGHKPVVQLLLKMGANVNAQEVCEKERDGRIILSLTALHSAIHEGHEDIAHILLNHGAAVSTRRIVYGHPTSVMNNTPLQEALSRRRTSLVRDLLDRGADVTVAGGYMGDALKIACMHLGDASLARLLLERGADPCSPQGPKMLNGAIKWKNEPLQQALVEYGADVALVDFDYIRSYMDRGEMDESEMEDYIGRIKSMLAQIERRPKPSIATPDIVE